VTIKDLLLAHLKTTFEHSAGQPSVSEAIAGLTASQAAWKPSPERHSIWQIVRHLTRWKEACYEDWQGRTPDYAAIDKGDWASVSGDDTAWQADVEALHEISRKYKTYVEHLGPEELERTVAGLGEPLADSVLAMATHDTYHAGQIRYVRVLQGV
jgi:hypothetical protein